MSDDARPNYMRLARDDTPILTTKDTPLDIGKAYVYAPGTDVTIVTTGRMVYQALLAAESLFKKGIDAEVVHCPTVKPLDAVTILRSARKTGKVITVEEHQVSGGLGGAVAELLGENYPVPLRRIGIQDQFGQSGDPEDLFEHYGLTPKHIVSAAQELTREL